jgi:hypothetical protein
MPTIPTGAWPAEVAPMSLSRFASLSLVAAGLGACADTPTTPATRIAAPPALSRASDQPAESRPSDAQRSPCTR